MQLNKLIGQGVGLAKSLTPSEQEIVLASQSKRIADMDKTEVQYTVTDLVTTMYVVLGQSANVEDKFILISQVVEDLYKRFSFYTIEEVRNVFYLGPRGEFKTKPDEVLYPTIEKINSWLKAYRETVRKEAVGKQLRFEQDNIPKIELSDSEKLKIEIECTIKLLEDSKVETGFNLSEIQSGAVYNTLDKLELIPFTVDRKKEIYKEAEELYRKKHSAGRDLVEIQFNKKIIAALNAGDTTKTGEIRMLAKYLALKIHLANLTEMDEDIIEILKEKQL
jgi:hypothetical protein